MNVYCQTSSKCDIIILAPVTFTKGNADMENNYTSEPAEVNEYSAVTVYAAQIFEQLSPVLRAEILELLRQFTSK